MSYNPVTFKCHNCGQNKLWEEAHKQETVNRGKSRYICNDCADIKHYGTGNTERTHLQSKHGLRIGFELECYPKSSTAYYSMISAVYGLTPTHDGSLHSNGVEFNTPVYQNMSGLKQMFRTFEEYADFADESCGHHVNVSHSEYSTRENMNLLRDYKHNIFDALTDHMKAHRADTIKVFGRDFCYYASDITTYSKRNYSAINLDASNRIEFRLAKFVNATQYFWLSVMCRDMQEIIAEYFWKRIEDGENASECARKTSRALVKTFKKYAEGKAHCQRPERNNHRAA